MKLNDKTYNILKWVALVGLSAVGTLYGTLGEIWGLPYGTEIVKTVMALELFLGTVLGISTIQYNKNK